MCLAPQPMLLSSAPVRWGSPLRPVSCQQSVMVAAFWGAIYPSSLLFLDRRKGSWSWQSLDVLLANLLLPREIFQGVSDRFPSSACLNTSKRKLAT